MAEKKVNISSVGISQISVAIPRYFLSLEELTKIRNIPSTYATEGLGVFQARIPYQERVEDLAAEALKKIDYKDAERFFIATESDPDLSKPFGVRLINKKLGLTRLPFQYKFACLGGVEALISACEYSVANRGKPAVVLALDRSIYPETNPAAEMTQGCAAVAMRVEANPKLLEVDYENIGQYAADVDDFRVPASSFPFPQVNGQLTKSAYLGCQKFALEDWERNNQDLLKTLGGKSLVQAADFFVMHTPFPKMTEWAAAVFWRHESLKEKPHLRLSQCLENPGLFKEYKKDLDRVRSLPEFRAFFEKKVKPGLKYNPYIGNSYTCSIFISLIAILEEIKKGQQLGMSGYGSGAGAICLRAVSRSEGFKSDLKEQLEKGGKLTFEEYQKWRESQRAIS
ncbi:hydroxymethylglutaryl-CoA synthase family protein [bacterium]|nr:hydroxymethylglutaryl-CoA synthase family protein [bacterium]